MISQLIHNLYKFDIFQKYAFDKWRLLALNIKLPLEWELLGSLEKVSDINCCLNAGGCSSAETHSSVDFCLFVVYSCGNDAEILTAIQDDSFYRRNLICFIIKTQSFIPGLLSKKPFSRGLTSGCADTAPTSGPRRSFLQCKHVKMVSEHEILETMEKTFEKSSSSVRRKITQS